MRKRISSSVELLQLLVIMQWLPTSTIRETENPLHCGRNVSFLPNNQLTLQCWSHQDFRPNVTGNIFILVKKSNACFFPSKTTIRFQGQISLSLNYSVVASLFLLLCWKSWWASPKRWEKWKKKKTCDLENLSLTLSSKRVVSLCWSL